MHGTPPRQQKKRGDEMTKWDKNAKKREKALKLLLDTFLENIYSQLPTT